MKLDTVNCSMCATLFAQAARFKSQLESKVALHNGVIIASPSVLFSPQPFSIAEILCLFVFLHCERSFLSAGALCYSFLKPQGCHR